MTLFFSHCAHLNDAPLKRGVAAVLSSVLSPLVLSPLSLKTALVGAVGFLLFIIINILIPTLLSALSSSQRRFLSCHTPTPLRLVAEACVLACGAKQQVAKISGSLRRKPDRRLRASRSASMAWALRTRALRASACGKRERHMSMSRETEAG